MYPALLFVLLVVLAGVIAYAGDVLGTTVGRRRLSLFGWRPKRTGRAVGIAAGVLIMLSTLGILSLAFRGATTVLLRSQQTALELQALRAQQGALEEQVLTTQTELTQARATSADAEAARDLARAARDAAFRTRNRILAEQDELQARSAELTLSNETLSQRNDQLSRQNAATQNTLNNVQNQLVTLNTQLRDLRLESDRQAQNLRDTLAQFEAASGSELTYRQGEIVYSGLVAGQQQEAIFAALRRFVTQAQQAVIARGASDVELRTDQLSGLSEAIAATPGEDLVVLVAADNFIGTAQIEVNVEAYENLELLEKGQLIASRQIHVGSAGAPVSRTALRAEVARLTQESLGRLQRRGLFEQVPPTPSEADFDSFTAALTRLSGPVVIGAVARQDIYLAGPAELEFIVLY